LNPLKFLNQVFRSDAQHKLTADEIEVRIWGFVVIMITIILFGIVFALLYSVTFVTQPIKSMAPIDQAYTKMLNDIVLLIVGGIGGIVGKRAVGAATGSTTTQTYPPSGNASPCPPVSTSSGASPVIAGQPFGQMPVWVNPQLDESWTPGPPPTTSADHEHPERGDIALERSLARNET
jgi:hypothetical protein